MDLSPRVLAAVEKYFSEPDRAEVKRLLSKYGDEVHHLVEAERIHLVILRISRKDVQRVETLVNMAKRDYRDVILAEAASHGLPAFHYEATSKGAWSYIELTKEVLWHEHA